MRLSADGKLADNLRRRRGRRRYPLRLHLVRETVASALRENSNKQVAARPRITHKAESLVEPEVAWLRDQFTRRPRCICVALMSRSGTILRRSWRRTAR